MIKSLIRKWWFWVLVVIIAAPVVWFLAGYVPFKYRMWEAESYRDMAKAGYAEMQQEQEELAEAYRNDTYGGKTPEETLRLYITALETADYDLSAKYYVYEQQQDVLAKNPRGVASGGFEALIDAYRNGTIKSTPYQSGDKYEIEVYPGGEDVPFGFIFRLNPFTKKWKILD